MKQPKFPKLTAYLPLITISLNGEVIGTATSNQKRTKEHESPVIYVTPPPDRPLRSVVSREERDEAIRRFNKRYPKSCESDAQ